MRDGISEEPTVDANAQGYDDDGVVYECFESCFFFFSSRRRHTRFDCDWSSDVCSSDLDWENAHRMESDRLRAENPNIDPKLLDSPQARYATLEKMVRDQVLAAAVQKMHLAASDAQLVRTLQEIPAIAALKKPDGSMDAERSEEHTSELQSQSNLVCRLLLEKKKK